MVLARDAGESRFESRDHRGIGPRPPESAERRAPSLKVRMRCARERGSMYESGVRVAASWAVDGRSQETRMRKGEREHKASGRRGVWVGALGE